MSSFQRRFALAFPIAVMSLGVFLAGCQTSTTELKSNSVDFNSENKGTATSFSEGQVNRYRELFRDFPEEPRYAVRLCQLELENGNYQAALGYLNEARKLDPDNAQYDWIEGRIYYAVGAINKAEQSYQELVRKSSDAFAGPVLELGVFYYATNRMDQAAAQLQKCIMRDGSMPEPHYYLGEIAFRQKDKPRAVHHFERYLKLKGQAFQEDTLRRLHQLQPELHVYNP